MIFSKTYRYRAAAATIFSKTYRDRAAAAMTFSKTGRDRAAMDISAWYRHPLHGSLQSGIIFTTIRFYLRDVFSIYLNITLKNIF
jgi:hypothetical protein